MAELSETAVPMEGTEVSEPNMAALTEEAPEQSVPMEENTSGSTEEAAPYRIQCYRCSKNMPFYYSTPDPPLGLCGDYGALCYFRTNRHKEHHCKKIPKTCFRCYSCILEEIVFDIADCKNHDADPTHCVEQVAPQTFGELVRHIDGLLKGQVRSTQIAKRDHHDPRIRAKEILSKFLTKVASLKSECAVQKITKPRRNVFRCPTSGCSTKFARRSKSTLLKCSECHKTVCIRCGAHASSPHVCNLMEITSLAKLGKNEAWKICPNCAQAFIVENGEAGPDNWRRCYSAQCPNIRCKCRLTDIEHCMVRTQCENYLPDHERMISMDVDTMKALEDTPSTSQSS